MEEPGERLNDAARSGVYRVRANACITGDAAAASMVRIPLANVTDKRALLAVLAQRLSFPDWFGGNWDALEDCLCDLSWRDATSHLLCLDGHARLRAAHPDDFGVLLEVLGAAAEYWRARGVPFFAIFVDPDANLGLPPLPPRSDA